MRTMDRSNDTPTDWRTAPWYERRVHFIGIGGSGMSGLAAMLLQRGAKLSGTDRQLSALTQALADRGAVITTENVAPDLPDDAELVVASAAVPRQHPILQYAKMRGVPILSYAEMLGTLMDQSTGIAVAGTHGKSTTTAWLTYVLREIGLDPSFVVGAVSPQLGGGSGVGMGKLFVAEACEYNRSFHSLRPEYAIVLNIDEDHLDCYKDLGEIQQAFATFLTQVHPTGRVIANGDNKATREILNTPTAPVDTFGIGSGNIWRAADLDLKDGCYTFDVLHHETSLGRAQLSIPGVHNVMNALAVIATAHAAGADIKHVLDALPGYQGVDRRVELKGEINGVKILDDYAHHPAEIRATLKALRERYQPERLWCVFQPHQHSRTRFLLADFADSFHDSDITIVPDIYFVRDSEGDREAVNAQDLVKQISQAGGLADYVPNFDAIVDKISEHLKPGDLVVTMGAGTIWKVADALVQRLQGNDSN